MLPTEKTKPLKDFADKEIILYGDEKIGKTTFLAGLPKCLIIDTEKGTTSIEAYVVQVNNWTGFLNVLDSLEKEDHPYKTVAVDTVDELIEYCFEFIKKKYDVAQIGDIGHGRGYVEMGTEFRRQIKRLKVLGIGIVFCSHTDILENEEHQLRMVMPACFRDKRVRAVLHPSADMILYATLDLNGDRIIHTKPTRQFIAGDRTGLPDVLPLNPESLIRAYYDVSADDGKGGKETLIAQITKGELHLAENKIDGFDVPARVKNSRKKHLEVEDLGKATFQNLQSYLTHLRRKFKKEKTNGNNQK